MEFILEPNELTVKFIEGCIYNFRAQRRGEFPTRILMSLKSAKILIDENKFTSAAMNVQSPYKIFAIKIVRCLDVDDNIIELH